MRNIAKLSRYLYEHRLVRYLFVGGTTFFIDLLLLYALHGKEHVQITVATTVAYWASIIYNFSLNRLWTFEMSRKEKIHKHLLPYMIILGFNYLFTVIFVTVASHEINYLIAKILAVLIQTSWTYFAYKRFVFKDNLGSALEPNNTLYN